MAHRKSVSSHQVGRRRVRCRMAWRCSQCKR